VEDSAAEVGELGTEAGERGREGGPVRGEVAVTPALVVVAAAQLTELELGRGSGARSRVRPLRRHRSGSRVCVHKQISDDGDRSVRKTSKPTGAQTNQVCRSLSKIHTY
jgi:hypothetical protein